MAHSDDILTGVTNEIGLRLVPFPCPLFPLELSDIPRETMTHLEEIQHESPLMAAGIVDVLEKSKKLLLKIQDIIAKGTRHGFCTVYHCEILSIDDQPIKLYPPLCLKLFDNRFQSLSMSDTYPFFDLDNVDGQLSSVPDERDSDEFLHHLFYCMSFAEVCALKESLAYKKLQQVQEGIVPWFYGMYQVSYMLQYCRLVYILLTPSSHRLIELCCIVS